MTFEQIHLAIVGRMETFAGIAQECIDYPNASVAGGFTPPEQGVWCRLNIQGGTGFFAGTGGGPQARRPGQIVIQCFGRAGAGTGDVTRLADALSSHFQFWREGDLECWEASLVNVGDGSRAGDTTGSGFYQINVVIRYVSG